MTNFVVTEKLKQELKDAYEARIRNRKMQEFEPIFKENRQVGATIIGIETEDRKSMRNNELEIKELPRLWEGMNNELIHVVNAIRKEINLPIDFNAHMNIFGLSEEQFCALFIEEEYIKRECCLCSIDYDTDYREADLNYHLDEYIINDGKLEYIPRSVHIRLLLSRDNVLTA